MIHSINIFILKTNNKEINTTSNESDEAVRQVRDIMAPTSRNKHVYQNIQKFQ